MGGIHSSCGKIAGGSSASPSLVVGTFITHCAAMEEKGVWSLAKTKSWLTGLMLRQQSFINSMDASDTVVLAWEPPMTGIVK